MGSSSKFHGLTGISSRRIKSNVAKNARKMKLNEKKKAVNSAISEQLKNIPEIG
jgi:vacuolar-type H+-ATPase subunit E/Vma4